MTRPVSLPAGFGRLAITAVTSVVDVVESMHATIAAPLAAEPSPPRRARGITRMVYATVRGVTAAVGGALDLALGALPEPRAFAESTRSTRAALNGICGDHLERTANPLATPMALLPDPEHAASGHVLLLVHGLCLDELSWRRGDAGHGEHVARALGCSPVYVRYNTGRRIDANGAELAAAIEQFVANWPVPVERITLLGHSMGGLVLRSACAHAEREGHGWRGRVATLVTLGTPHGGAPLERLGQGLDRALRATRWSAPLAAIGASRSAGITDLRDGSVGASDVVPSLPVGVRSHAVAAMLGTGTGRAARLRGDGLVPLESALGRDQRRPLGFAARDTLVVREAGHFDLLSDARVRKQLVRWLRT